LREYEITCDGPTGCGEVYSTHCPDCGRCFTPNGDCNCGLKTSGKIPGGDDRPPFSLTSFPPFHPDKNRAPGGAPLGQESGLYWA